MEFPNCSLVNASPVNNGSGTIYQTMSGPNGQQADLFSSGMQYSSKYLGIQRKFEIVSFLNLNGRQVQRFLYPDPDPTISTKHTRYLIQRSFEIIRKMSRI
jgi:hypothetical protein